jgi:hypothetical protein
MGKTKKCRETGCQRTTGFFCRDCGAECCRHLCSHWDEGHGFKLATCGACKRRRTEFFRDGRHGTKITLARDNTPTTREGT